MLQFVTCYNPPFVKIFSSIAICPLLRLGVWQSLAVVVLVSAADSVSPAGFWAHHNIVTPILTYLLLRLRHWFLRACCSKKEIKAKRKSTRADEDLVAKRQKPDDNGMCCYITSSFIPMPRLQLGVQVRCPLFYRLLLSYFYWSYYCMLGQIPQR